MAKNDYVTFLNSAGEEISNDPRWLAEKTLREAGVGVGAADFDIEGAYDNLTGAELKAEVKKRGIKVQGRKASDYRQALEDWDDEHSDEADDDDDSNSNDSGDGDESGDSGDDQE